MLELYNIVVSLRILSISVFYPIHISFALLLFLRLNSFELLEIQALLCFELLPLESTLIHFIIVG